MKINRIDIFEDACGFERARIPGLICTDKGTLIAYCELRRSESDWAVIDIGMKRSTDGGKSWSERQILVSGEGSRTANNPVMIAGRACIYFLYCIDYSRVFLMKSTDEGESWSSPRELTREIKESLGDFSYTCIATGPTHGICTDDGTILVPVWMSYDYSDPKSHHPSVIALLYSRDSGESFFVGKTDGSLSDASECAAAQLSDGRIYMTIRHEGAEKCRARAFVGNDFSIGDIRLCSELPDPVCCAGVCALGDGLLFCNCADAVSRSRLTLRRISADGEISESLLMASSAGYSDVAVSPAADRAYVLFEQGRYIYFGVIDI